MCPILATRRSLSMRSSLRWTSGTRSSPPLAPGQPLRARAFVSIHPPVRISCLCPIATLPGPSQPLQLSSHRIVRSSSPLQSPTIFRPLPPSQYPPHHRAFAPVSKPLTIAIPSPQTYSLYPLDLELRTADREGQYVIFGQVLGASWVLHCARLRHVKYVALS